MVRLRHTLAQAMQHFELGQIDEAEAVAREALTLLPDEPLTARLLGLIAAVRQDFTAALALLRPIGATYEDDPVVQTALAEAVWSTQSAEAAIPLLRRVLQIDPDRHRVRGRLGVALLLTGQPEAAREELRRAIAGRPDDGELRLQLSLALRDLGELGAAIESLRAAVARAPELDHLHTALGSALLDAGDAPSAMAVLAHAVQRDPASPTAWMLLGRAATLAGQSERAVGCYRRALRALPQDATAPARAALANALHATGDRAGAATEFGRLMHPTHRRGASRQPRVGVIAAPGAANTPTEFLIDRTLFSVETVFVIEGYDYPIADLHDRFDVVFNAISDPDASGPELHRAAWLAGALGRRVINPPDAIRPTTRDAMAASLTGLEGAVVPRTQRCDRAVPLTGCIPNLRFPLLLRPIGSHGGSGMIRVADHASLRSEVAGLSCETLFLTEYCDFRSMDGWWRKYRVVFVGGVAFPYHLAIGADWLNHYFRTETNRNEALRREEARFLEAPGAALGPHAMRALDCLSERVGLEYFGVDFSLDAQGRMIVFECNAAMRVRGARPGSGAKEQAADRIRNAMTAKLIG